MNKTYFLILTALLLTSNAFAQSKPLIYFCEKYESGKEIGISDRFSAGNFTIILRSKNEFGVDSVYIQTDKYNTKSKLFEYYSKLSYAVNRHERYAHFSRDVKIQETGIFRVFILNTSNVVITSNLIEITK